jgi:apolipoprotein N-acyltransferase
MKRKNLLPVVWFILGFGVFTFTRMSKIIPTVPVAILIAPIFILRFSRTQPGARGNLLTLLGFILSINIGLWGLFDLEDGALSLFFNLFRSSLLAVLYFLPYMIDRVIYPRLRNRGSPSALIFPTATTAIFFLSSLEGPFDGAVQAGKFVYGPLVAQQLLSLLGVWAFIFISSWFASLVNYSWENNFDWGKSKKSAIAFAAIVVAVLGYGAIKTQSTSTEQGTVKIAAIILVPEEGDPVSMEEVWADRVVSPLEEGLARIEDLTRIAASNEAKIVSFQELALIINEEDEERVREGYRTIARENDVYLSVTYAYFAPEGKGENKHLLIDNNGQIQLDYTKRYVGGLAELDLGEAGVYRKGPEIIQSVDTPYGRIAISICRDMEFPQYMRQAGKAGVDIMLSPAYEWPKGLVVHSVYMRALENGFSLVRPTYNGITIAEDFNGRIISQMDSAETDDGIVYAEVPIQGINTIYTTLGDLLGWLTVLGLGTIIVIAVISRVSRKRVLSRTPVFD